MPPKRKHSYAHKTPARITSAEADTKKSIKKPKRTTKKKKTKTTVKGGYVNNGEIDSFTAMPTFNKQMTNVDDDGPLTEIKLRSDMATNNRKQMTKYHDQAKSLIAQITESTTRLVKCQSIISATQNNADQILILIRRLDKEKYRLREINLQEEDEATSFNIDNLNQTLLADHVKIVEETAKYNAELVKYRDVFEKLSTTNEELRRLGNNVVNDSNDTRNIVTNYVNQAMKNTDLPSWSHIVHPY